MNTMDAYEAQEQLERAKMKGIAEAICAQYDYQNVVTTLVAIGCAKMYNCHPSAGVIYPEEFTIFSKTGWHVDSLIINILRSGSFEGNQPELENCWIGRVGQPDTLRSFAEIVAEDTDFYNKLVEKGYIEPEEDEEGGAE